MLQPASPTAGEQHKPYTWQYYSPLMRRDNRLRAGFAVSGLCLLLFIVTPRVPQSPAHHLFADMRNLLGVPNTINVLTSFPFLLVGVPALVFCLTGGCFAISSKGEKWGWTLYFAGISAAAFGSAYYHIKPDDDRVYWDRLPIMISTASLLSTLVIERVDDQTGTTCLFSLVAFALVSVAYERIFNDLRLSMLLYFVSPIVILAIIILLPPKYSHSRLWLWAAGFYLLSRFEAISDSRVYNVNHYIISGHSLEHLCLVMGALILAMMLWLRSIRIVRDS